MEQVASWERHVEFTLFALRKLPFPDTFEEMNNYWMLIELLISTMASES